MLLAIDVGNTNTVFALHDGERFVADWRIATSGQRTSDEYFVWLNQLMQHEGLGRKAIKDAIIAQVVPQTLFNLRTLCKTYFDARPLVIGDPDCDLGAELRVDHPREVGADRVVNTVGAYTTYGPDLIVVDFGTATNFDVVDSDGAYIGGVIAPGVNLSLDALQRAAAKLPRIAVERPESPIGKNTVACMQSGVYWGYVSLIEGVCRRIMAEYGKDMKVIATGGLSPLFAKGTDVIAQVDEDLTMRGLIEIYRRNRGAKAVVNG